MTLIRVLFCANDKLSTESNAQNMLQLRNRLSKDSFKYSD
jgi:hypothetical protein